MEKHVVAVAALGVAVAIMTMMSFVFADVPQLISFQGKLYNSAGNPLSGDYSVTFRIYNAEEGGTALWSETSMVNCSNGLYNVILGLSTPVALDFDGQHWLGVQVAGSGEMYPRFRIVSVPVAFRAAVADSALRSGSLNGKADTDFAGASHTHSASEIISGTLSNDRLLMGPGSGLNADMVDGKHADEIGTGNIHDHWGQQWEGDGTGLDLFALNDGTALETYSEDGYSIEAQSGGQVSLYGWTGKSGITEKSCGVLGEGYSSYGVVGLSNKESGVAGWSKEKPGVTGYSSAHGGVSGLSEDGTGVYGSSSTEDGVYGESREASGVFGRNASSGQKVSPAGVVGEGRHGPGVAGYSYDGYGLYGVSGQNSPGVYGTSSGDSAIGVYGTGNGDYGYGVRGTHSSTYGGSGALGGLQFGVYGLSKYGTAIVGESGNLTEHGYYDVVGALANGHISYGYGVYGAYKNLVGALGSGEGNAGVYGRSQNGFGVRGTSTNNRGVAGSSTNDAGVSGYSTHGVGVHGSSGGDTAVFAEGNLVVSGEYWGDIGPNNGAPFPRPAYDSKWRTIAAGAALTLNHNIGGDRDDYVVDLQFQNSSGGVHQMYYGLDWDTRDHSSGAYWYNLTTNSISVRRGNDDTIVTKVRVRIWSY